MGNFPKSLKSEPCPLSNSANVSRLIYEDIQKILDEDSKNET